MQGHEVHVGTSGWHYDHWVGPFYPEGTASESYLSYYMRFFQSAEVNNTFYHLPQTEALARWRKTVPERFVFACKASRFITHMKKLKDPDESVERFFDRVSALGDKLGPILFQLPPRWRSNPDRLGRFLDALPEDHRYAFEFRDKSWFEPEVFDLLTEHNAAFCIYDLGGFRSPIEVTADFVYLRLHGPGGPYQGSYDGRTLFGWSRRCNNWLREGRDVYCYFDNDQAGFAVKNALRLSEMIERERALER